VPPALDRLGQFAFELGDAVSLCRDDVGAVVELALLLRDESLAALASRQQHPSLERAEAGAAGEYECGARAPH
jgi:hypothetical protein